MLTVLVSLVSSVSEVVSLSRNSVDFLEFPSSGKKSNCKMCLFWRNMLKSKKEKLPKKLFSFLGTHDRPFLYKAVFKSSRWEEPHARLANQRAWIPNVIKKRAISLSGRRTSMFRSRGRKWVGATWWHCGVKWSPCYWMLKRNTKLCADFKRWR